MTDPSKRIILDTNFLVAPFQLSVSIFEELDHLYPTADIYTLESVIQEAKSIEDGKYKKLVEKLLEKEDIEILEDSHNRDVDDALVEASVNYIIATNDKELKNRLLDRGREVVIIRSENYLEVINRDSVGF